MRSSVYQPPSTSSSLERCCSLMRKICFWNSSSRDRRIKNKSIIRSITIKTHELIYLTSTHGLHQFPGSGRAFNPMHFERTNQRQREHVSVASHPFLVDILGHVQPASSRFRAQPLESHIECMRRQLLLYDVLFQLINTQISDNVY